MSATGSSARPSNSRLKAIGSRLRKKARGEDVDPAKLAEDDELIDDFRHAHAAPMNSVAMGMRSMSRTLNLDASVSQRLKTKPTIREKLSRHEDAHDLSRMRDIGGVRAVVDTVEQLRALEQRAVGIYGNKLLEQIDYIDEPRASGYRAVHLVVERHDLPIEIQLRTVSMHSWAENVEFMSRILGVNYKQDGDEPFQRFMLISSLVDQAYDKDEELPRELLDEAHTLSGIISDQLDRAVYDDQTLF